MARTKKTKPAPVINLEIIAADLTPEREFAEARLRDLHALPLDTQEQADLFGQLLVAIRTQREELETKRKTVADPLTQAKKALDALFRPLRDLYDAMDRSIVDRLAAWRLAGDARQVQALAAVAPGARDEVTLSAAHGVAEAPEALIEVDTYDVEVLDETLIPRHFLCFDRTLAVNYVKSKKGLCTIDGCKIVIGKEYRRRAGG